MKKIISWFLDNISILGYLIITGIVQTIAVIQLYRLFGIIVAIVVYSIAVIFVLYILDIIAEQEKAEAEALLEHQKIMEDMNRRVNFYSENEDEDK